MLKNTGEHIMQFMEERGLRLKYCGELEKMEKLLSGEEMTDNFGLLLGMILNVTDMDSFKAENFIANVIVTRNARVSGDRMDMIWKETCLNYYETFVENLEMRKEAEALGHTLSVMADSIEKNLKKVDGLKKKADMLSIELNEERRKTQVLERRLSSSEGENFDLLCENERVKEDNEALKRVIRLMK